MTKRIEAITDEMWETISKENRQMVDEFISSSVILSNQTLKQYVSALRIFFYWVHKNLDDKLFSEIKSRDYLRYQNYLIGLGMSSSGVRLKRSAISSFNNYIEVYYQDEFPMFRNYITKGIPAPTQTFVRKKEPLTIEEYNKLCDELEKRKLWQQLAYLKFSFSSGARRAEVRQLRKEVVDYDPKIKNIEVVNENGVKEPAVSKFYTTHKIRCKGRSKEGKVRRLPFGDDAMNVIKKWLNERGEDNCKYVFISGSGNTAKQISAETFNLWCRTTFTEIVGRRVHPHLIRETRATSLVVEEGKSMDVAQKLLGHESSSTTEIYVVREDEDDPDEAFI